MKLLEKYLIKKYFTYFVYTFLVIGLFVFLVNFFESSNILFKKGLPFSKIILISLFESPLYISMVFPLVSIIAVLLLLNYTVVHNEQKAVYSSGFSYHIFLRPIIITGIILVVLNFAFSEILANNLYKKSKYFRDGYEFSYIDNVTLKLSNIILSYKKVNIKDKILEDVYIEDLSNQIIIKTDMLKYESGLWKAVNGMKIDEKDNKSYSFITYDIDFLPVFKDILIEKLEDRNYFSFFDLVSRIHKFKRLHVDYSTELVLLNFKIAMFLLNFNLLIIGFILSSFDILRYRMLVVSIAIIIALLCWFLVVVLQRLSEINVINPFMITVYLQIILLVPTLYLFRKRFV